MQFPAHGVVHQARADKLVVRCVWKLPIDLDVRLGAVRPVLVNDLLIDLLVGMLDRPRVHKLRIPKLPLGMEALIKIPVVAPRVAEGQPKAVWCVLSKEPRRHTPNAVVNTAGFVEHQQDAGEVVDPGVGVRVLGRPQPPLDVPIAGADLEVAFHQLRQPLGRQHPRRARLEPMAVERHAQPLGNFRPGDRPKLRLAVGRHHGRTANPRREHPNDQPGHQRRLANTAPRRRGPAERVEVNLAVVGFDMLGHALKRLALPPPRSIEFL